MSHRFYLFAYTCCLTLFLPLVFPFLHLLYFGPFLIICFYRSPLSTCLWWALSCGFIIDLFSSETRLGTYALNYCLTTLCLYNTKFHFFEDRPSTIPLMSFGFTILSTLIQVGLFYFIAKPIFLSWVWAFNDLLVIPFQVAIYATLAFVAPTSIFSRMKRRYLLFKLKRRGTAI
jgi:rod shape-determining protein MreD